MADTQLHFHAALDGLKDQLVQMGAKAEQSIDLAVQCYATRNGLLCSEILSLETEMAQRERNIDEIVLQLQVRHQPRKTDLRLLTACMKINANLKSIGILSVQIADLSLANHRPRTTLPVNIPGFGAAVSSMVRRALDAFVAPDGDIAEAVFDMGEIIRRRSGESWIHLVAEMRNSPESTDHALNAILIMRTLERMADHAALIAEDILFWMCGMEVRHRGARNLASLVR